MVVALSQVRDALPDIVLWDCDDAKIRWILQRIKGMHPRCAALMLTGINAQPLAKKAMNFAAFDFISKPLDVIKLGQKVIRAFERLAGKSNGPAHG